MKGRSEEEEIWVGPSGAKIPLREVTVQVERSGELPVFLEIQPTG